VALLGLQAGPNRRRTTGAQTGREHEPQRFPPINRRWTARALSSPASRRVPTGTFTFPTSDSARHRSGSARSWRSNCWT